MIENQFSGVKEVQKGLKDGRLLGVVVGTVIFAFSIYAFSLSIKANKLTIKKLESEGFK